MENNNKPADMELAYNARLTVPDHPDILKRMARDSAALRVAWDCRIDLAYDAGEKETFDFFPAEEKNAPLHIFIHGGYWRAQDKADFSYIARPLLEAGMAVGLVNYALCPAVTLDHIVDQMRRAMVFCWQNAPELDIDRQSIHVSGHSAGGHLVGMLLATDWATFEPELPKNLIKSGLSISGLFDVSPLMETSINNDVRLEAPMARRNSPLFMPQMNEAPMVCAVGSEESSAFHWQSAAMAEKWPAASMLVVPESNHFTVLDSLANSKGLLCHTALRLAGLKAG